MSSRRRGRILDTGHGSERRVVPIAVAAGPTWLRRTSRERSDMGTDVVTRDDIDTDDPEWAQAYFGVGSSVERPTPPPEVSGVRTSGAGR
jgi:hypothetical protein